MTSRLTCARHRVGTLGNNPLHILACPNLYPTGRGPVRIDAGRPVRFPLLCERSPEAWLQLLHENRALQGDYDFSRTYSHWGVLAQAAAAGQGIALVPYGIAFQDILAGTLRVIACRSAPYASGYRFLANPRKEAMPKVQQFRAWIVAEMTLMQDHGLN